MRSFEKSVWWSVGLLLFAGSAAAAQDPPAAVPADSVAPAEAIAPAPGPATVLHGMPQMGFYAAPFSRFGYVRQQLAVYPGMRLGVVLDQSFAIGVSVGLLGNHIALDTVPGKDLSLKYGGLELEALIFPRKVVNGSLRVLGGAGLLSAGPPPLVAPGEAPAADPPGAEGTESAPTPTLASAEKILIVEPGAEVTLNLSSMLRFSVGWSYRLVRGVDSALIGNDDLSGWLGSLTMRIAMY